MSRNRGRGRGNQIAQGNTATEDEELGFYAFSTELELTANVSEITFIIDSGATENLIQEKYENDMYNIETLTNSVKIKIANGDYLTARKRGTLKTSLDGIVINVDGLVVPGLSHNLLSVKKMMEKGFTITFSQGELRITGHGCTFYGERYGRLYIMNMKLHDTQNCNLSEPDLWHKRLGHINRKSLAIMKLPYSEKICGPCMEENLHGYHLRKM